MFTSVDSEEDLESPKFFHYAQPAHRMMKKMGYDLHRGDGLNFEKGRCILLQPFMLKGKPPNYYNQIRRGVGYVTPSPHLNQIQMILYHHILQIHRVGILTLV